MDVVRKGGRWIDRELSERAQVVAERASSRRPLSPRERELVELVRQGLRNRDIAERLGVTEGTVKVYLHGVFGKLGIGNRTGVWRGDIRDHPLDHTGDLALGNCSRLVHSSRATAASRCLSLASSAFAFGRAGDADEGGLRTTSIDPGHLTSG